MKIYVTFAECPILSETHEGKKIVGSWDYPAHMLKEDECVELDFEEEEQ